MREKPNGAKGDGVASGSEMPEAETMATQASMGRIVHIISSRLTEQYVRSLPQNTATRQLLDQDDEWWTKLDQYVEINLKMPSNTPPALRAKAKKHVHERHVAFHPRNLTNLHALSLQRWHLRVFTMCK